MKGRSFDSPHCRGRQPPCHGLGQAHRLGPGHAVRFQEEDEDKAEGSRTARQAVDRFAPYEKVQDPYPEGRSALTRLMQTCIAEKRELFAFVNNRFEGSAVGTIETVTETFD